VSRYPSYPIRSSNRTRAILLALVGGYLLLVAALSHEVRVREDIQEFHRLDSAAVVAQDLVNALDVLRQPPQWQRRIWSAEEIETRYTQAVLEADAILQRATALEHATAYPCTIRTFYRECFR
jgi:hypothetical protein